jgi:DNA-binding NarL/FixJ family response regulator
VAEGLSNREIGEQLYLTENTVKSHLDHLGTELGTRSRTQMVTIMFRLGLLK